MFSGLLSFRLHLISTANFFMGFLAYFEYYKMIYNKATQGQ